MDSFIIISTHLNSFVVNRRNAIKSFSLASSHVLFPSILGGFVSACRSKSENIGEGTDPLFFNQPTFTRVQEIMDLIIPRTNTASASEVGTHYFVDEVFAKCMDAAQQQSILEGINAFLQEFNAENDKGRLINQIDQRAFSGDEKYRWFIPLKQYTLIGFFTSQEGETRASNYVAVPGDYQGDVPVDESTLNLGLTGLRYYL